MRIAVFGLARPAESRAWGAPPRAAWMAWLGIIQAGLSIEPDRLALWLPVCVGIGDAIYFAQTSEPPRWPALLLAACSLPVFLAARGRQRIVRLTAAAILAASAGFLAARHATSQAPPVLPMPRRAAIVSGEVAAIDVFADGTRRLTLAQPVIDGDPPQGRLLRLRPQSDDQQPVSVGNRLEVRAMLRDPMPPSLAGGRDLQRDAFFGGLAGSGTALDAMQIEAAPTRTGLATAWQYLRERIAMRIAAVLPGTDGAIAATLLSGISSAIPQDVRRDFAVSGLAHLLAVAGLHLGIVMGLAMGAVRMGLAAWEYAALRLPSRQIAASAALVAGAFYMVLTGMHLPTERSLTMAALGVLALLTGRRPFSLRGLGIAALGMLLLEPASLLTVSFQMSFAAVLALIGGYEALRPWISGLYGQGGAGRRLALHVFGLAMTSLLAGTACLPYAEFHFGHIQLYFVLANLAAVPLTAIWVMPLGLIALGLMPLGLERIALVPMGWGIELIVWLARIMARLPQSSIPSPAMPVAALALLSLGLIWLCLRRGKWRLLGLPVLLVGLLSPYLARPADLLVSSDASLIVLRVATQQGPRLLVEQKSGANKITLADWGLAEAIEAPVEPFPTQGRSGPIDCDSGSCTITLRGRRIVLIRGRKPTAPADLDCAATDLLISASPLPRICPGVARIDRFTVYREGAVSVWVGRRGVRILSVSDARGKRPWVPVPGRRRLPNLPMAVAE